MRRKFFVLLFLLALCSIFAEAQPSETDREWNKPVEPFRIIGNIYYVGAAEITSFLITTPKGHILLDGGFVETVPQIKQNIAKLGFRLEDVKILLNSQAHYDHAGGLAELKRLTGARLFASEADSIQLAKGGKGDFGFGDMFPFEPIKADEIFKESKKIKIGGTILKANITPGHTKGCTTWTMTAEDKDKKYEVIFVCSTTAPAVYNLVDNKDYPNIVEDYLKTFERLRKIKVDVFLASHGNFFELEEKSQKLRGGSQTNPFIDPKGYLDFINNTENAFRERVKKQREEKK